MKNWKKTLKNELDQIVPELREDVKNAPIIVDRQYKPTAKEKILSFFSPKNKKVFSAALSFALVFVFCLVMIPLFNIPTTENVVIVEINPKVALVVDEKGVVTEVSSLNVDSDVILQSKDNIEIIKGKTIGEAVKNLTDVAFKLGYLKENGAVKISALENSQVITSAIESVESYFCEKGLLAVVFSQEITKEQLVEKIGFLDSTVEDVIKTVKQTQLFSKREANKEKLKELYDDMVDLPNLSNGIKLELNKSEHGFRQYKELVLEIEQLNEIIVNSNENPGVPGLNDYWSIKSGYFIGTISDTFKALIDQMEELLNEYTQKYGKSIESWLDFHSVKAEMEIVEGLFESADDELIQGAGGIINILKMLGSDVDYLANLFIAPDSFEDYISKTGDYYQLRIENNRTEYDKEREEISPEVYLNNINRIILEYGDLETYWQSIS